MPAAAYRLMLLVAAAFAAGAVSGLVVGWWAERRTHRPLSGRAMRRLGLERCEVCHGNGRRDGDPQLPFPCIHCGGRGAVRDVTADWRVETGGVLR